MIFVERIKYLREEWKLPQRKLAVVMDIDTTSAPLIEENKNKTRNKKYASDNLFVINSLVSLSCVYLRVMGNAGSTVRLGNEKRHRDKNKKLKYRRINDLEKVIRMEQRYFINAWLLPCSLRSHRTANPRPKMGFAIFRLYPPTTRQAGGIIKID